MMLTEKVSHQGIHKSKKDSERKRRCLQKKFHIYTSLRRTARGRDDKLYKGNKQIPEFCHVTFPLFN
jgi:hypothetical protein